MKTTKFKATPQWGTKGIKMTLDVGVVVGARWADFNSLLLTLAQVSHWLTETSPNDRK